MTYYCTDHDECVTFGLTVEECDAADEWSRYWNSLTEDERERERDMMSRYTVEVER